MTTDNNPVILVTPKPVDDVSKRNAAKLWPLLVQSEHLGTGQLATKRVEWEQIYAAVNQAKRLGQASVRIPTGNRESNGLPRRQIVRAAIDMKILLAHPRAGDNVRMCLVAGKAWK